MLHMTGSKKDRFFKLASGGIMMALSNNKNGQGNLIQGAMKLLGAVFVIYGLTGWDPVSNVSKAISKTPVTKLLPGFKASNNGASSPRNAQDTDLVSAAG